DVLKKQTFYAYDSYGNRIEESTYLNDGADCISTLYSYDNPSNAAYNGAYLTRKWTEGVKDADGGLIEPKSGNSPGIIDETYTYDWLGNLTEKQDGRGSKTSFQYDNVGRILKQIDVPTNTDKVYVYTTYSTYSSISVTDENLTTGEKNKFQYIYDPFGNMLYEQDMITGQNLKSYTYDKVLRLNSESNINSSPNGWITTYQYYSDGRAKIKETRDKNNKIIGQENYAYDDAYNNGQYYKITRTIAGDSDSPSITTNTYVNNVGLTEKAGRMYNGVEYADTYKYDYVGNRIEEKSARANDENWTNIDNTPVPYTAKYDYDYAGNVVKTTLVDGKYATTVYDELGRKISSTDFKQNTTSYIYDRLGRLIEEHLPFDGNEYTVKKHYYDRNGNVTLEKVKSNKPGEPEKYNTTGYEYNSRNLLAKVTTYKSYTNAQTNIPENYTQYYYDWLGNKVRMYTGLTSDLTITSLDQVTPGSDKSCSITKYDYDRFGNLVTMTDPLNKTESYVYNINGTLKQKTDRNGNVTSMTYDGLDRLLTSTVATPDGSGNKSLTYTYTLAGNKLSSASGTASTSYLYDDLGRLVKEITGTITKEYSYDAADNRKSLQIKQNGTVITNTTYTYDTENRLKTVSEGGALKATYTYDDNGNRQLLTYANDNSTVYEYNLANKLKTLTNKKGTATISQYTYTYYLDGNQASKTDNTGKVTSYTYDGLGRLTSESPSGEAAVSYTYDDYNNSQQ
ncbi:MAG TPA: hypothetical protein VHT34_12660, partial [Clostridia bacterium]|nr:hypothetical protein [Clostridia bacterium]